MRPRPHLARATTLLAVALGVVACSERLGIAPVAPPPVPAPMLPSAAGRFAPAHLAVRGDVTGAQISEIDSCSTCHPDVFAQQQASAHAWSSFSNPVYRFSVQSMRAAVGNEPSRMCGGCHDVALLVDGALDVVVEPTDPRAHAGVTCRVCHGVAETAPDGNGSLTLHAEPIPLPREGDVASVERHRRAVAPIRTPALCGACHRGFLSAATGNGHFLPGMDELTGHAASAYSGNGLARIDAVEPADCIGCHMAKVEASAEEAGAKNGRVASHRFAGGHTWLAAMLADDTQLEAQRAMLRGAATIDITGARVGERWSLPADGAPAAAGESVTLDVVVRNTGVGHRFPAGVLDAQDTFIVVTARDARGALVASAGADHEAGRTDPGAHVLRALVADQDGVPRYARDVQHFRAVVVNHTIAARDAAVVRYRLELPAGVAMPVAVEARLLHRSRNLTVARLACADASTPRGVAFDAWEKKAGRRPPDPCVEPPITVVARHAVELGDGASTDATRPLAPRLTELGMALSHTVSERLDEARVPLMRALEALEPGPTSAKARAAAMAQLARVAGRQGRTEEALGWVAKAEAEIGPSPPLAQIRGDALARVWRWQEAEVAFTAATRGSPGNPSGWRALAIARGSLGRHLAALEAARRGLELDPRDPDLLRVQALAVRDLGADEAVAERALEAYDQHRRPDRAADIRVSCARTVHSCALERQPVHTHEMTPAR